MPNISFVPLNAQARQLAQDSDTQRAEQALIRAYATSDDLKADLDKLAVQVEKLLAERAHTIEVLSAFYRSDISMSSLQPLLDLCCELAPALRTERRR